MKYASPKTVDTPLTLIFRMLQGAFRCCFCQYRLPIWNKLMSATSRNITYSRCKAKNHWHSVDAHAKNAAVTVLLSLLPIKLPIRPLCITMTKLLVNYDTYKTTNRWRSVDAYFNVLSIQHLLLSIIVFILIWLYQLAFCWIETQPCGKAEGHHYLALFTLTWLKIMYHAKRFIAPAIHLFMNRYSQGTYHSPIIYLYLKLSVKLQKAGEPLTHSVLLFIPSFISLRFSCIYRH